MIVDVNVSLSRWPCRRLPDDETRKLLSRLEQHSISGAWAGTFDGLLHNDVTAVNSRLATECRELAPKLLIPFGTVNLALPGWQDDLRRCREEFRMPGIRLHPNYHGYKLDSPEFADLLRLAGENNLIVQIALAMEDERTQHRLLRVAPVDTTPLAKLLSDAPQVRVVLLNSQRSVRDDQLAVLAAAGLVYFDISTLEGIGGVARSLKTVPLERLLFGSQAPYFSVESAILKMQESELANFQREAILFRNAQRLFARP